MGVDAYVTGGLSAGDSPTEAYDAWDIVFDTSARPEAGDGHRSNGDRSCHGVPRRVVRWARAVVLPTGVSARELAGFLWAEMTATD